MSNAGPSSSSSSNTQNSVQGGSGTTVGEISGDSNIVNDPALQLATVNALANEVNTALAGGGQLLSQTISGAQSAESGQATQDNQSLAAVEDQLSQLASYQGTGGASYTQYVIYAVLGLGALFALMFFWKQKS